jgi:hypothetical protein
MTLPEGFLHMGVGWFTHAENLCCMQVGRSLKLVFKAPSLLKRA